MPDRQGFVISVAIVCGFLGGIIAFVVYPPMTKADHAINLFGIVGFFHGLFQLVTAAIGVGMGAALGTVVTLLATKATPAKQPDPPDETPPTSPTPSE